MYQVIGSVAAAALALALAPGAAAARPAVGAAPVAATTSGKVAGSAEQGVLVFKGIRYGADTAPRRFRPALPPKAWKGTAPATAYGATCPQITGGSVKVFASWANDVPMSEDCLFLNVWTRGLKDGKKRPVMVWFHGGGYVTGSGSSHNYDGVRLAQRGDVVLVTVNHRLNAFGYLHVAGLTKDPAYAQSGNVGSLDMVQSLQWVRDNIANFGGDPGNVTIFGESGGAAKVSTMMAFPPAQGLFHKVIAQSGSMSLKGFSPEFATDAAADVMAKAGFQPGEVGKLATMPWPDLVKAMVRSKTRGAIFQPVTDGTTMPRDPFDPDASPLGKGIPLLVGTNLTEMALQLGSASPRMFDTTWDDLPARIAPFVKPLHQPDEFIASQRARHPTASAADILFSAATWRNYRRTAINQAERKAAQGGAPVYMYRLDWRTPVDGGKWRVPHALELAFMFDNVAKSESMVGPATAENQRMADLMSDAWIAFARTGNPQTPALPRWPAYDTTSRATLIFDLKPVILNDPEPEERKIFTVYPIGRADG